ncbi:arylamine N-acetyltransferase family protein [Actinomadura macrotermitis]|uniref:Proansamycin X synthase n=1 Tax=Actinomadura macrotermitis TaxID=2585200 RepID=A0A7K0BZK2_9ACTN|nr:arylamine N-acetyltransferase [Actinomadura macrotermitis]MQY06282.1 Proansamycin X synthase [Actinomadura macrotermitis]
MFDPAAYLATLGLAAPERPDPAALRRLHLEHVRRLPYDNAHWIGSGRAGLVAADIDLDASFDRIVRDRRGGNCLELAGSFHRLLGALGFDAHLLGAALREPDGRFSTADAHMLVGVRFGADLWLADVGFAGPGFIEPLRVAPEEVEQYGVAYRVPVDATGRYVVERRPKGGAWQPLYRFADRPRRFADWYAGVGGAGCTPDGRLLEPTSVMRSRATGNGQRVLVGRLLTTVEDGAQSTRVLVAAADLAAAVHEITEGAGDDVPA